MTKKRLLSYRQLKAELKWVSTDSDDYRRLKAEIAEIEAYVSSIDDAFIRIIFGFAILSHARTELGSRRHGRG